MKGSAMVRGKVLLSIVVMVCFTCDVLVEKSQAIWLNLPATGTKCVSEEIQHNVVVLADYVVVSDYESSVPTISVKVTSPYENILHHKEDVTHGQFAFTTSEAGNHQACLWVDSNPGGGEVLSLTRELELQQKIGNQLQEQRRFRCVVIKCRFCEGVELELRKLQGSVEAILINMSYLKIREAEMRIVTERTNARVAWFSIMSLGICITVSGLQLWHLKQFFKNKKLI